ncbi:MAG: hypothetical protein M3Y27_16880 [Acidobacteriota bacterium]|nr:hypothetical protein [Acidobacteriota bacterium]
MAQVSFRSLALMAACCGDAAGLTSLKSLVSYRNQAELSSLFYRLEKEDMKQKAQSKNSGKPDKPKVD